MQINPTGLEAKSAGLTPSGVSSITDIYIGQTLESIAFIYRLMNI